jgi:ribosomal protein S10
VWTISEILPRSGHELFLPDPFSSTMMLPVSATSLDTVHTWIQNGREREQTNKQRERRQPATEDRWTKFRVKQVAETSIFSYQTTRRRIPEHSNLKEESIKATVAVHVLHSCLRGPCPIPNRRQKLLVERLSGRSRTWLNLSVNCVNSGVNTCKCATTPSTKSTIYLAGTCQSVQLHISVNSDCFLKEH